MKHPDSPIRLAASVVAVIFVAGAMVAVGSYSNAKFEVAASTVQQRFVVPATEVAIAPARIEVIGAALGQERAGAGGDADQLTAAAPCR